MEEFTGVEEQYYNLLYNDLEITIFESWVYESAELKNVLSDNDYLEIMYIDYRQDEKSKREACTILEKYIDVGKIETKRILSLLYKSLESKNNDLREILVEMYDMYCHGYNFFDDLGMGYGLECVSPTIHYLDYSWEGLTEKEQKELINSFSPDIIDHINRAIGCIENQQIIFHKPKNEYGLCSYTDRRD